MEDEIAATIVVAAFSFKGFNQDEKRIGSWTYANANPADNIISLWGFTFVFDGKGRLYDPKYGLVGHLIRGLLKGSQLTFKEEEAIKPGRAHLNVV